MDVLLVHINVLILGRFVLTAWKAEEAIPLRPYRKRVIEAAPSLI